MRQNLAGAMQALLDERRGLPPEALLELVVPLFRGRGGL